jgi:sucrose-6-phosphate hydrolase SacC (GH32 family)
LGVAYALEAEIDVANLESPIGFRLRVGLDEETLVLFDPAREELSIDRTRSGNTAFSPEFAGVFRAPLTVEDGLLKLEIFVDRCSVEVFAQDGTLYGAALIFPSRGSEVAGFVGDPARLKVARIAQFNATTESAS